ncbi:hypothetical protein C8Q75DRAFT_810417 [Abortiporus biennis]|nr:hypothetical protein C8Q75DRAFT_810417 [Abortiporus biennis]
MFTLMNACLYFKDNSAKDNMVVEDDIEGNRIEVSLDVVEPGSLATFYPSCPQPGINITDDDDKKYNRIPDLQPTEKDEKYIE